MKQIWKRRFAFVLCAMLMLLMIPVPVALCLENEEPPMAEEISGTALVESYSGMTDVGMLFNKITADIPHLWDGARLTLKHDQGIGSLYLLFSMEYGSYRVINEDTGEEHTWGQHGFLHDFLDLEGVFGEAPSRVTLCFDNGSAQLHEIYAFSSGQVPAYVQKWEPPEDGATDLVLFSTHGDDEQLFFAGVLPYYGAELGYQVQVVYMTDHRNITRMRTAEMLNGLWAVGIRTYPVFGHFPDLEFSKEHDPYAVYMKYGHTEADLTGFVVEQIRRFKPKVAIGHDVNGEYGHAMHILYTQLLMKALEISNDPEQFSELAEQYGVWDVPKTYIHLYPENKIVMDWDVPLESFGGMTAYEVTRDLGFPSHVSQIPFFAWYFAGIYRADALPMYSPCEYGLYRSTVGEDVEKNDFFENLTTYAQDAEMEQLRQEEEARRAEEERLAEQAAAMATEALEVPETTVAPTETEPLQTEPQVDTIVKQNNIWFVAALIGLLGAALGVVFGVIFRRKKEK